jgi:hypothetical protein
MQIDPRELKKGPILHETLSDEMVSRVRSIRAALLQVYPQTMEAWLDGFKRDTHPEKEVLWWEHLSACFLEYFWTKCQNDDQAKSAFRLLLQIGLSGDTTPKTELLSEDHVDFLQRAAAFALPPPETDSGVR